MEDSQLIKITQSNIKRALDGNVIITNFLNTHEQEIVKPLLDNNINWYFDGGYEASEYKRLVLSPLDIKPSSKVSIIKVNYNKRFVSFTHRHILGNLMAMGVKRETIGDIVISDDIYFVCKEELENYFINEVKTMNNYPVTLEKVSKLIVKEEKGLDKTIFPASLRLDAIVSLAFGLSREISQKMICDEMVKVNQKICKNNTYQIKNNDLISVKTKGRIKINQINGLTKSGRIGIGIEVFK